MKKGVSYEVMYYELLTHISLGELLCSLQAVSLQMALSAIVEIAFGSEICSAHFH
jgi:hypothetical protein